MIKNWLKIFLLLATTLLVAETAITPAVKIVEETEKKNEPEEVVVVKPEPFRSKYFKLSQKAPLKKTGHFYLESKKIKLPNSFTVKDVDNDGGGVLKIVWQYNIPEYTVLKEKTSYKTIKLTQLPIESFELYRQKKGEKIFSKIATIPYSYKESKEVSGLEANKSVTAKTLTFLKVDTLPDKESAYSYKLKVKYQGLFNETKTTPPIMSDWSIFNTKKVVMFIASILISFFIIYYIKMARSGKDLYIRRIAGLDAVDDAVGRATEMGRAIMFIPGITDMDDPQTIAGVTILGRVAKLTAEYKTPLSVPVSRSMVMITGREIVKESYLSAGHPENYHDEMVHYLTDDQFGFAAGVDGIMVREKPATVFLQGSFFAESLILAETGHHIGAIQIAGTAQPSQLPFFITSCDYTLIGEELYAASAYLSREPQLLGSLRGQDLGKAVILVAIIIGVILETISVTTGTDWLSIKDWFMIK